MAKKKYEYERFLESEDVEMDENLPTDEGDEENGDIFNLAELEILFRVEKETINHQFNDPMTPRKDHLSGILKSIQKIKNDINATKDLPDVAFSPEDCLEKLNKAHSDLVGSLVYLFKRYLNIGISEIGDMSDEDQDKILVSLYEYFILNIKKNFVQRAMSYIADYKTNGVLSVCEKKKDITTLSLKTEIDDEDTILIISNICNIIDYSLRDVDVDEFLLSTAHQDNINYIMIQDLYNNFTITGNFVRPYMNMITVSLQSELELKVREKVLKQYRNRMKETV